jgi:hypothetical protein
MVDANEIALEVQSTAETDWSTLIDRLSIPPAQVKRAVVFDAQDRLLDELPLPNGSLKETPTRDDPQPEIVIVRDQGCPECGRPVVVVYKPWGMEPPRAIHGEIRGNLEALSWHDRHPR